MIGTSVTHLLHGFQTFCIGNTQILEKMGRIFSKKFGKLRNRYVTDDWHMCYTVSKLFASETRKF